uniref:THAP domain-containing protein 1 n=1 Tax=Cyprinodon variegatus TaxID=28743 RepID=A0A3Q2D417_CYPVA
MVKACDYPGCANKDDGKSTLSFHRFPLTDVAVRQLWLLAVGFHVDTRLAKIKKLRVCSAHFSEDDYASSCPRHTKKRILKSSAVPATLACAPVAMAETAQSEAATSEEEPALQSTPLKSRLDKQQFQIMLTSPADAGPSKKPSTSGTYIALPGDCHSSDDTSTRSSSSDNIAGAERRGDWSERKWIVNESCLMELFTTCHTCGISICEKKITSRGSKITIEWTCINHHTGVWQSSQLYKAQNKLHTIYFFFIILIVIPLHKYVIRRGGL